MSEEHRETVKSVRQHLLDLHKLLLDRERGIYEKEHGAIGSPGEFLQIAIGDSQFEWLRVLSSLIIQMDEMMGRRSKADDEEALAVLNEARALLKVTAHGTDFQRRYWSAIQESPDVVIAQCKIEALLG